MHAKLSIKSYSTFLSFFIYAALATSITFIVAAFTNTDASAVVNFNGNSSASDTTDNKDGQNGDANKPLPSNTDKKVGDACSFSAEGALYSGVTVDQKGIKFCSSTQTAGANSSSGNSSGSSSSSGAPYKTAGESMRQNCKHTSSTGTSLTSYIDNCGGTQPMNVVKTSVKQDGDKKPPAIIFVHGGGWFADDGNFSPSFQNRAAKWGFTSIRIKYRLMPGGVDEQLQDVLRAVKHVRANADKLGVDKNRIAIWGDSAGGSLAVRAASTGSSGVKAAVGWSAPTNAFRDLFNSYDGWVAGLYHTRCFGSEIPASVNEILNTFLSGDPGALAKKLAEGQVLSPEESTRLLNFGLKIANVSLVEMPAAFNKLQASSEGVGFSLKDGALDGQVKDQQSGTPVSPEQIKQELSNLSPTELAAIGVSIFQFTRSIQGISSDDPATQETISIITQAAAQVTQAQKQLQQERAVNGTQAPTSSPTEGSKNASAITSIFSASNVTDAANLIRSDSPIGSTQAAANLIGNGANALGINPQQLPAKKIAECIGDFIELSPALFASPRSPQMFLVNAAKERWVNPLDAYQMRDKLRSMGIQSNALVLPHTNDPKIYKTNEDGHMGYDQRAEVPSFQYLHNTLRSKTEAQARG